MGGKILILMIATLMPLSLFSCFGSMEPEKKAEEAKKTDSDTKKGAGAFDVNACSLITQKEAEGILGEKLQAPTEDQHMAGESSRAAMSSCLFPGGNGKSITIFYRKSPIAENTPEAIQAAKNSVAATAVPVEDVGGVGDSAFRSGNEIHVFEGDRAYIIVTVNGFADETESSNKAKQAAEIAVERV